MSDWRECCQNSGSYEVSLSFTLFGASRRDSFGAFERLCRAVDACRVDHETNGSKSKSKIIKRTYERLAFAFLTRGRRPIIVKYAYDPKTNQGTLNSASGGKRRWVSETEAESGAVEIAYYASKPDISLLDIKLRLADLTCMCLLVALIVSAFGDLHGPDSKPAPIFHQRVLVPHSLTDLAEAQSICTAGTCLPSADWATEGLCPRHSPNNRRTRTLEPGFLH